MHRAVQDIMAEEHQVVPEVHQVVLDIMVVQVPLLAVQALAHHQVFLIMNGLTVSGMAQMVILHIHHRVHGIPMALAGGIRILQVGTLGVSGQR